MLLAALVAAPCFLFHDCLRKPDFTQAKTPLHAKYNIIRPLGRLRFELIRDFIPFVLLTALTCRLFQWGLWRSVACERQEDGAQVRRKGHPKEALQQLRRLFLCFVTTHGVADVMDVSRVAVILALFGTH